MRLICRLDTAYIPRSANNHSAADKIASVNTAAEIKSSHLFKSWPRPTRGQMTAIQTAPAIGVVAHSACLTGACRYGGSSRFRLFCSSSSTPGAALRSRHLKWAFVILTAFTGPLGAFFYVLGCREPLRGTHDESIATRWRQVLGSTMRCVASDGIGIVVAAAVGSGLALSFWPDFLFEYVLGLGFGWAFFQAFAMRDTAGGSCLVSLKMTFLPEPLSMNLLMTGMVLTSSFAIAIMPSGTTFTPERRCAWSFNRGRYQANGRVAKVDNAPSPAPVAAGCTPATNTPRAFSSPSSAGSRRELLKSDRAIQTRSSQP